jgi:hypothetical protein
MAKPKAAPKGADLKTNKAQEYQAEMDSIMDERARSLDELQIHDELMSGVLESIRVQLRKGATPQEILAAHAGLAAARVVTIAATDQDSGRALTAAKDILDRVHGKAKETRDVTHRLDKVKEEQLDALLLSELDVLEIEGKDVEDEE